MSEKNSKEAVKHNTKSDTGKKKIHFDDIEENSKQLSKSDDIKPKIVSRNTKLVKSKAGKLNEIKTIDVAESPKKGNNINIVFKHDDGNEYTNNTNYKLTLKKSKIRGAGLGVFADEDIPDGKLLSNYDGKLVRRSKNDFDPDYSMEINDRYVIDGSEYPRPLTSMINDTYGTKKVYNCEFLVREKEKVVQILTIKPIAKGDELYIDYGGDYWTSRKE